METSPITMLPEREPAPIEPRRPDAPAPSEKTSGPLIKENLFWSLVAGPAVMASLSTAALLQHFLPDWTWGRFPLAGLLGLALGWTFALPAARWSARGLDPERPMHVMFVAVLSGLVWAIPAAMFAPAIGWMGGGARILIVAGVLSASGLIWGGYLNLDAPEQE